MENAAARVCWQAGENVCTNAFLRDMDLGLTNPLDEVVVDGLRQCGGAQLAVDMTLGASTHSGRCCQASCCHHERRLSRSGPTAERSTLPKTRGESGARLVVLAGEGWSFLVGATVAVLEMKAFRVSSLSSAAEQRRFAMTIV